MWFLNQNNSEGLTPVNVRLQADGCCVHIRVPEGQVLQFCPDFLPVKPDGVFLAHALGGIETGSNQSHNVAIQEPSQELPKDLRSI